MNFLEKIDAAQSQLDVGAVVVEALGKYDEIEKSKDESFMETAQRLENDNPELSQIMARADKRWMELERIRKG